MLRMIRAPCLPRGGPTDWLQAEAVSETDTKSRQTTSN